MGHLSTQIIRNPNSTMGKGPKVPAQAPPIKTVSQAEISPADQAAEYQRKRNKGFTYDRTLLSVGSGTSDVPAKAPKTLLGQ